VPGNTNFTFPDGGWVCSQCQNYNFLGRQRCHRCTKVKTKHDYNGKPKHLLKRGKHQGDKENVNAVSEGEDTLAAKIQSIETISKNIGITKQDSIS